MSTATAALGASSPPAAPPPKANPLLTAPILPTLIRLSLPNMAAMLATALVAVAETIYVGRLGTASLAGMALVFPMVMLQQTMSAGAMGGGVSSAVSRALGAGDEARARSLALHAALIGLLFGGFFLIVFLAFGPGIYALLGGRDEALHEALLYSNIVFLGAPAIWMTNTLASIIRGSGNMKVPSATLFIVAAAQVLIGGGLGLGLGPLPRLGMVGVAAGSALSFTGGALYLFWILHSGRLRVSLTLKGAQIRWDLFRDILKVGAISCLSPVQTVLVILILTRLVAEFGTEALAGYGIGSRLEFLLIPITFAIGVAGVPLVGMAIGAGNIPRARAAAWTAGGLSALMVGTVGVVVALFPDLWAGLFTDDPGVLASARSYLRLAGPAYALFGLGLCLYFCSQGAGRVLGPVLAGTLRLVMVALGGWYLAVAQAEQWTMFALIGLAMAAFGLASAASVYFVSWGPRRA